MKTSVIEVRDMLSVLSVQGVEQRIGEVPGVESVTVNFAAGNATVRFDETDSISPASGWACGNARTRPPPQPPLQPGAPTTTRKCRVRSRAPPEPDATKTATAAVAATGATTPEPPESAPQSAAGAEDKPPHTG